MINSCVLCTLNISLRAVIWFITSCMISACSPFHRVRKQRDEYLLLCYWKAFSPSTCLVSEREQHEPPQWGKRFFMLYKPAQQDRGQLEIPWLVLSIIHKIISKQNLYLSKNVGPKQFEGQALSHLCNMSDCYFCSPSNYWVINTSKNSYQKIQLFKINAFTGHL